MKPPLARSVVRINFAKRNFKSKSRSDLELIVPAVRSVKRSTRSVQTECGALSDLSCRAERGRRRSRLGAAHRNPRGSAVSREAFKLNYARRRGARECCDKGLFGRAAPPARSSPVKKARKIWLKSEPDFLGQICAILAQICQKSGPNWTRFFRHFRDPAPPARPRVAKMPQQMLWKEPLAGQRLRRCDQARPKGGQKSTQICHFCPKGQKVTAAGESCPGPKASGGDLLFSINRKNYNTKVLVAKEVKFLIWPSRDQGFCIVIFRYWCGRKNRGGGVSDGLTMVNLKRGYPSCLSHFTLPARRAKSTEKFRASPPGETRHVPREAPVPGKGSGWRGRARLTRSLFGRL